MSNHPKNIISSVSIRDAVERRSDEIIEWTKTLIRFPSENRPPDGNEGPAQEFIKSECGGQGWEVDTFSPEEVAGTSEHPSWLAGRNYTPARKDVVARWPGKGGGQSLLLSGHVDVAPYEPDAWKVCRPYEPIVRDGRLYGRGSADMKGGMAAAFWAMRILMELGFEPAGDVLFESVVDEEFASGNGTLAARLRGHNADLAVVCEPTRMRVCPACLGAFLGDLTITGNAGMPYMGTAIPNPIDGAARATVLFSEWQDIWRAANYHPLFAEPGCELNILLWKSVSTRPGEFTQMGTPLSVKLSWIVWCHPGTSEEDFYARFRAFWEERASGDPVLSQFEINIERDYHYVKPWETGGDDPGVRAVINALARHTDSEPLAAGAPFSCDLGTYGEIGSMPSVLLGPHGGNLHAPDEWASVSDILDLTCIYADLAATWCSRIPVD